MADAKFKPVFVNLTDNDVDRVEKLVNKLKNDDIDKVNKICEQFYHALLGLIATSRTFTKDDDDLAELDRIKRLLCLIPKFEVFIRVQGRIWHFREKILESDMDYFLSLDYSGAIKKDHKAKMIESIIAIVKDKFPKLSKTDQTLFWQKTTLLLKYTAEFRKIIGDF